MRDYSKISTSLWRSKKFRSIDDDARLFYLYLHTCPHVNSVGCFVIPEGYMKADLGWSENAIRKAIDSLCKAYLIAFDKDEELVRIIDFLDHEPFTNPKHAAGGIKIALSLPNCKEKANLLKDLCDNKHAAESEDLSKAIDRLSKGYRNPEPEPEPEPELNPPSEDMSSPPSAGSTCPTEKIISLYRENCPSLITPKVVPDAVRKTIAGRWRESDKHRSLEFWEKFFQYCESSDFLAGRADAGSGRKPFRAGLEWVVKPTNFAKIINGNYANDR